ncbi:hypothetical protein [Olivibacter domesticus]|uniref:Uncharacterized protein n=1 Tax=Olivibacter domesticus TaxID=407022 RepID=A0A1H7JFA1_OLID1|nr:hypothetical protein [Olivibacter domesticus]SEK73142.1 hypothetical protein SAMN05661044_00995 [Olivibacter domesticus]
MREEFSKEQIEEYADGLLNTHKEETKKGKPFSFTVNIGDQHYTVSYAKNDDGSWKFQDFKELE